MVKINIKKVLKRQEVNYSAILHLAKKDIKNEVSTLIEEKFPIETIDEESNIILKQSLIVISQKQLEEFLLLNSKIVELDQLKKRILQKEGIYLALENSGDEELAHDLKQKIFGLYEALEIMESCQKLN